MLAVRTRNQSSKTRRCQQFTDRYEPLHYICVSGRLRINSVVDYFRNQTDPPTKKKNSKAKKAPLGKRTKGYKSHSPEYSIVNNKYVLMHMFLPCLLYHIVAL